MIKIIAAIGSNNELGYKNNLVFRLNEDLALFKEMTLNKTIVMGHNTFLSLPGMLPYREHIVLTNNEISGVKCVDSVNDLINYSDDFFVIGGALVYKQFIDIANVIYLTEIEASCDADVYFPEFDKSLFHKEVIKECSEGEISFKMIKYERI